MLRLFFTLITLCGVSIAIRPNVTQSSAGCPVFSGGEWDEYYTSPLYINSRPDGRRVIGSIMQIQLGPNEVVNAARHHIIPVALLMDSFESFISRYIWMPGNIFIGPSSRHDDPSNDFESDAVEIVDPNNFRRLRELNSLMVGYIHNQNVLSDNSCVGPVSMDRIVELIRNIRHVHTLYNGGHWRIQPGLSPMIQWENDPNVVLQVAQQ